MNKVELIAAIAKRTGLSKNEASAGMNAMIQLIMEALGNNEKVTITGFGAFDVGVRQARAGVNPYTLKATSFPEMRVPRFLAGKALKALIK